MAESLYPPKTLSNVSWYSNSTGHGSTNNKILIFDTLVQAVGTAITRSTSAAAGDSFTVNEAGLYGFQMIAIRAAGTNNFGISLNSAQLTTAINAITLATRMAYTAASANIYQSVSGAHPCAVGDIFRPHDSGASDSTALCQIKIVQLQRFSR